MYHCVMYHLMTQRFVLMVQVKNEDADFGWGVVVNFCKKANVKVRSFKFI